MRTPWQRRSVPALIGWALRYELSMWASLFRWILRRPVTSAPDEQAFPYASTLTPVLLAFIGISAVEIPILELLLVWPTARTVAVVLGGYGLFWMIGMLASYRVAPHVVGDSGFRLRHGGGIDVTIPWDAIASIRTASRALPKSRAVQYEESAAGGILNIVILKQTNVDIVMRQHSTIQLSRGESELFTELRCYADDPDALVAAARHHLVRVGAP